METTKIYNENFYNTQAQESYISAKEILSYLYTILQPKNVIDIGCGVGTWLKAWQDLNPKINIAGIDGNEVVSQFSFITQKDYKQVDLTKDYKITLNEICNYFANISSKTQLGGGSKRF